MHSNFGPLEAASDILVEAQPHWVLNLKNPQEIDSTETPLSVTRERLPKPKVFLKTLQEYYPKYKNKIIYIGRGIFAVKLGLDPSNEVYYIIGEVNSERMETEDFLNDTNVTVQFEEFKELVAFTLNVYIYDILEPKVSGNNIDTPF